MIIREDYTCPIKGCNFHRQLVGTELQAYCPYHERQRKAEKKLFDSTNNSYDNSPIYRHPTLDVYIKFNPFRVYSYTTNNKLEFQKNNSSDIPYVSVRVGKKKRQLKSVLILAYECVYNTTIDGWGRRYVLTGYEEISPFFGLLKPDMLQLVTMAEYKTKIKDIEVQKKIVREYLKGMSSGRLSKKYGISDTLVMNLVNKWT